MTFIAVFAMMVALVIGIRQTRTHPCWPRKFGGRPVDNYGAWTLCTEGLRDNANVWSFGVGGDISFEIEVKRFAPNADIRSFDPTITRDAFARLCEYLPVGECPKFHAIGLASYTGLLKLYRSFNKKIGSLASVAGPGYDPTPVLVANVSTLADLMAAAHISHLDVLKIDIEGAEFDLVASWVEDLPVTQLAIELHERFFSDGRSRRTDLIHRLALLGFRQMHTSGDEMLFVNNRLDEE